MTGFNLVEGAPPVAFNFAAAGFVQRRDAGNMWHWHKRAGDFEIVASAADCGDYPTNESWAITVARVTGDGWALGHDGEGLLYQADNWGAIERATPAALAGEAAHSAWDAQHAAGFAAAIAAGLATYAAAVDQQAAALAAEFVATLNQWLGAARMAIVAARNGDNSGPACASHDFCDANMAMQSAFETVLNRPPFECEDGSAAHDADIDLWNLGWSKARAMIAAAA